VYLCLDLLLAFAFADASGAGDDVLAERIRRGDAGAFKAFFERHHRALYGYLRKRGVEAEACEDLVQNAFIAIWERRAEIDPGKSLRAYLYRAAYNRALNHFRDTARFTGLEAARQHASPGAPDKQASYAQVQDRLEAAVRALPERRRAVFELCFLQEFTYREAAETLGISIKTVENQMGHALSAIREALAPFT
jgi:RNA polymerase sigma-70 factor (ECF subfamily)